MTKENCSAICNNLGCNCKHGGGCCHEVIIKISQPTPTPPTPSGEKNWEIEFDRLWSTPQWGRRGSSEGFYYPPAEDGDEPFHDSEKIKSYIRTLLSSRLTEIEGKIEENRSTFWGDEFLEGYTKGNHEATDFALKIIKEAKENENEKEVL